MDRIRAQSLEKAQALGYAVNLSLPLLDQGELKTLPEVTSRFLSLYPVVACSYGYSKKDAVEWMTGEGVFDAVAESEKAYLDAVTDGRQDAAMQWQVEGLWALAWCLSCHSTLDFSNVCAEDFVQMLPDLTRGESAAGFRETLVLRSAEQILEQLDLAYCLHWAIRDSHLRGHVSPGRAPAPVVIERRRALEWVAAQDGWDEVSLDT